MSLINQMLKDLEQRGAGGSDVMIANTDKTITTKLGVISKDQPKQLTTKLPYIKIGGLMVILAVGVYLSTLLRSTIPQKTEAAKTFINNSKIPTIVNITNQTSKQKIEEPLAVAPIIASAIEKPANSESSPLFATEHKYKPIPAQTPSTKADKTELESNNVKAHLIPETVNSAKTIESDKSMVADHLVSKPLVKLNVDNVSISKQIRPDQKSENFYQQALINLQQGRVAEAQANLTQALEANQSNQEARQTLAGLLIDNKRNDEAKAILTAGLVIAPEQSDFRMALARLQVEAGDRVSALNTLEQGLIYAKANADYQSFFATLLQRLERHEEAINHYMIAISLNDATPNSLIGLGISLQAVGKLENAKDAFTRAQASTTLTPELSQFIEQQLKQINQRLHH